MSDLPNYGVEDLFRAISTQASSFDYIERVFKEISEFVEKQESGMVGGLCELFVPTSAFGNRY